MTEQTQQINRVYSKTSDAVLAFIKMRLSDTENNGAFTADQLRFYVTNNVAGGVSPGSSDRILRMLRQEGKLNYIVLNRGKSLYRAVPLNNPVPSIISPTNVV
jgi:phage/plasmid-associated DNA primase